MNNRMITLTTNIDGEQITRTIQLPTNYKDIHLILLIKSISFDIKDEPAALNFMRDDNTPSFIPPLLLLFRTMLM